MNSVIAKTSGDAWIKLCKLVMSDGGHVMDGKKKLNELLNVFLEVEKPIEDEITNKYADQKMIKWMRNDNFGGTKPVLDWGYCYGTRLRNFNGFDQISYVVEKLKNNPDSKSATVSTIIPDQDAYGHVPCIVTLDFKIRSNKLNMVAFFRSQDVGKKVHADILSLGDILREISDRIGVSSGKLFILIASAHIYGEDFISVNKLLKQCQKK